MDIPLLSIIVFLPLLGSLLLLLLRGEKLLKSTAIVVSLLTFAVSLVLFFTWAAGEAGMQFQEVIPWYPELGINYHVGVDGVSLVLVLLTTFLMPLVLLFSWEGVHDKLKAYLVLMLLLETAMLGVFVALDLVLFFVFFEASLIPMYFLVGRWGGPRRIYAALKFFIFTAFGSAFLLAGIIALGFLYKEQTGQLSFDLLELTAVGVPLGAQVWLFFAFAIAFAIKVPIFPFHTWLPDAHVEAPTGGSVILAGVLLKMGTYGFVRFSLPLFPEPTMKYAPIFIVLAIIGILYGALVALAQKDLKKLVAYSSVAHLGFVMLGIFTLELQGLSGAVLQMVNHGLSTGALFLLVGFIYERRHTRDAGRLRRAVENHAHLRRFRADHLHVQRRAAGAERLRRRVHHPGRRDEIRPGGGDLRHAGHHPGRLVSALGVYQNLPRQAGQPGQPAAQGPQPARDRHHGAAGADVPGGRPVPQPVPR